MGRTSRTSRTYGVPGNELTDFRLPTSDFRLPTSDFRPGSIRSAPAGRVVAWHHIETEQGRCGVADSAIASGIWTNWAGNVRATPRIVVTPGSIGELRAVVVEAAGRGETVRVAGAGHSFAPLC